MDSFAARKLIAHTSQPVSIARRVPGKRSCFRIGEIRPELRLTALEVAPSEVCFAGVPLFSEKRNAIGQQPASGLDRSNGSPPAPQPLLGPEKPERFHWGGLTRDSLVLLGMMHGKRLTEAKTRSKLGGHWWRNYVWTLTHVNRWYDGRRENPDPPMTEYFNHGVMGAISGFIFVQNDRKGRDLYYGNYRAYWVSRAKVFLWAGLFDAQWKLGPISEASLGHPKVGYVTFVSTPVIGTAWVLGEDLLERYVVLKVERKTQSEVWRGFARGFLTPTRSAANICRIKKAWHRDSRPLGAPFDSFAVPDALR